MAPQIPKIKAANDASSTINPFLNPPTAERISNIPRTISI